MKNEFGTQRGARKVLPTGLEPVTFRLLAECSNQLSYESLKEMSGAANYFGIATLLAA